jgi:hypothetical protein
MDIFVSTSYKDDHPDKWLRLTLDARPPLLMDALASTLLLIVAKILTATVSAHPY